MTWANRSYKLALKAVRVVRAGVVALAVRGPKKRAMAGTIDSASSYQQDEQGNAGDYGDTARPHENRCLDEAGLVSWLLYSLGQGEFGTFRIGRETR